MAIVDLLGRLCETLRISNVNCVTNCCNGGREDPPNPRDSVPVVVQTEQSGRNRQAIQGSQEADSLSETESSEGVSADAIRVHSTQAGKEKVQKKKSDSG